MDLQSMEVCEGCLQESGKLVWLSNLTLASHLPKCLIPDRLISLVSMLPIQNTGISMTWSFAKYTDSVTFVFPYC